MLESGGEMPDPRHRQTATRTKPARVPPPLGLPLAIAALPVPAWATGSGGDARPSLVVVGLLTGAISAFMELVGRRRANADTLAIGSLLVLVLSAGLGFVGLAGLSSEVFLGGVLAGWASLCALLGACFSWLPLGAPARALWLGMLATCCLLVADDPWLARHFPTLVPGCSLAAWAAFTLLLMRDGAPFAETDADILPATRRAPPAGPDHWSRVGDVLEGGIDRLRMLVGALAGMPVGPLPRLLILFVLVHGAGMGIVSLRVEPFAAFLLAFASAVARDVPAPMVDDPGAPPYWLSYGLIPSALLLAAILAIKRLLARRG